MSLRDEVAEAVRGVFADRHWPGYGQNAAADAALAVVRRHIEALPGTRDFDQHAPGPRAPLVRYVKRDDVLALLDKDAP